MDLTLLAGFPRPDMARENFQSLVGEWEFEYDRKNVGLSRDWGANPNFTGKITVPFCVESEASGIGDADPPQVVWYAKRFEDELPRGPGGVLLHFGAVDHRAMVWLNGVYLGEHSGGYTPFSFEVGEILRKENLLVVRVEDKNDPALPRGKQSPFFGRPFAIFYETVMGIWQPVWLERTGGVYLKHLRIDPDPASGEVRLACCLAGAAGEGELSATAISSGGEEVSDRAAFSKGEGPAEAEITLSCGELLPWSPQQPILYGLRIGVDTGASRDEVLSYFGARTIEVRGGRVLLNGEPLYQKLVLHQGYYPRGLYTPPDPSYFRKDVEMILEFGFNGLRMHVKNEAPPLYFWCDYLGCLVLQDMPSAYRFKPRMREALEREWREVVERNRNHPCVIIWIPFNESWGVGTWLLPWMLFPGTKNFVKRICGITKEWDRTRLVIDNSGYDHTSLTDIVDVHHYLGSLEKCEELYEELKDLYAFRWSFMRTLKASLTMARGGTMNVFAPGERYSGQPIVISEYGGFGFYNKRSSIPLLDSYAAYTELIQAQEHIQGYCYTQFHDTWQEANGLVELDRSPKVAPEEIRKINQRR